MGVAWLCYVWDMIARVVAVALVVLSLAAGPTLAARPFPKDAKLVTLSGVDAPNVNVDGEWKRLAPGATIYDTGNRIVQIDTLPAKVQAAVQYEATTGFVAKIWLLNDDEAAQFAASH